MRNIPKPLRPEEYQRVLVHTRDLARAFRDDSPVTLNYTKRNGQESSSHGKVDGFVGNAMMDTFSVNIVDVNKGIRTINLVRVKEITL